MSRMNRWSRSIFAGALLATVPALSAQERDKAPHTLDAEYAQMAERVPGFGGLYLDEKGTTHVYLKDPGRAREVQGLGQRVEVHQGEYDFQELLAWKKKLQSRLAQPGVVFLDIDEQRNRLVFGVERDDLDTFTRGLRSFSQEARVPSEALIIEAAEPIVPQVRLIDPIRPVPGGVQIQSPKGRDLGQCTLGFNVVRQGVRGFVTNSHCTATRGPVDGTVFFQNVAVTSNRIGVETADSPVFVAGNCPSGRSCSTADAAFVAYDSVALSARGQIANPPCMLTFPGPLEIRSDLPRRPVVGSLFLTPQGVLVAKVGSTTGCTMGTQTHTCVDTNILGSPILMLCQNAYISLSDEGDSGAPVIVVTNDSSGGVFAAGIHWGSTASGLSFYSPWLSVDAELRLGGLLAFEP